MKILNSRDEICVSRNLYKTGKKSAARKSDWYDEDFVREKTKTKKKRRRSSTNFSDNDDRYYVS